ncbi:VWA domain-containing protein [Lacipirellula sp.]|uniref:VWA domain-containing protein n=1 Tax=Lacipirellula sp. TaxID=2691419 RepID=UPI003D0F34E7
MADSIWVVLLDTSGSMGEPFTQVGKPTGMYESGGWSSKIEAAKDLLIRRMGALRTPDIAVIEFKEFPTLLFNEPATRFHEYIDSIRDLRSGGGTDLAAAISSAATITALASYAQVRLLIVSDGLTDSEAAGIAADELRITVPQATVSVLLIDQTDQGDETAFRVATNDDVTYAYSYADVSSAITGSAADLLAFEIGTLARKQRLLVSELLDVQERPSLRTLEFEGSEATRLTADVLTNEVIPVLKSMEALQGIADSSRNTATRIQVTNISQTSPIKASVSGIAKAVEVLDERLTPWKREHSKEMANLAERRLKLQLSKLECEALHYEGMAKAELRRANAEAERFELENEERRLKLDESRFEQKLLVLAWEVARDLLRDGYVDHNGLAYHQVDALNAIKDYMKTRFNARLFDDQSSGLSAQHGL